jgi:hypothetical protein
MVYITRVHKEEHLFTNRVGKRLKDALQYKENALNMLEKHLQKEDEYYIKKSLWHLYRLSYFQEDLYKEYLINKSKLSLKRLRHAFEHVKRLQERSKDHFPLFLKYIIDKHYKDMEDFIYKIIGSIEDLTKEDSHLLYLVSGQKSLVMDFDHIERHKTQTNKSNKTKFTSGSIFLEELHDFLQDYKKYFEDEKKETKKVTNQIKSIQTKFNKGLFTFQRSQKNFLRQLIKYRKSHIKQIRELTHLISDYTYSLLEIRYSLGALACCFASLSFSKHIFRKHSYKDNYINVLSNCKEYLPAFPQLFEGYKSTLEKHKTANDHALAELFSLSQSHWVALPKEA